MHVSGHRVELRERSTYKETGVERCNETDEVEGHTGITAEDTEGSFVRKLVEGMAL